MENNVFAEVEIGEIKITHYTSISLSQHFNDHHQFSIRINHDVLESQTSFSLQHAQQLVGQFAIIRFTRFDGVNSTANEFRGVVYEIVMEQSNSFTGDLVLHGFSPTIALEAGPNFTSFYHKKLGSVVQQLTKPLDALECSTSINVSHLQEIAYTCQYRESTFHYLKRLSSTYSEWFFYDGKALHFGKPASLKDINLVYGEDVTSVQFKLKMVPSSFRLFSYHSRNDQVFTADAAKQAEGLSPGARTVETAANNLFTSTMITSSGQRVDNKQALKSYTDKQKFRLSAGMEVLTGTSSNPSVAIGVIASLQISKLQDGVFIKDDHGKFLITAVEHHVGVNGRYHNTFEALPEAVEVVPVENVVEPVGESQVAVVRDNNDPESSGRVRVQMLWQQDGELTDWIRVMTPDAGSGADGAKNRGFVFIPEVGDQVIVAFRYNDPDRPFVLGSLFHGKTGGGGGSANNEKSLTALSGSVISMKGDAVNVTDAKGNTAHWDGKGNISITSSESISLNCGESAIVLKKDGTIEITGGKSVQIEGTGKSVTILSDQLVKLDSGSKIEISGTDSAVLRSNSKVSVESNVANIKGDTNLKIESQVVVVKGNAMTNVNGGILNLNCS